MIFPIPKSRQAAGTNFSALGDFRWSMVEISPKDSCSALFQLFKIRFYIFLFQGLFPTPTAVPPAGSAHNMLWALPAGAIFQALDHLYIFRYTLLGKKQPPIPYPSLYIAWQKATSYPFPIPFAIHCLAKSNLLSLYPYSDPLLSSFVCSLKTIFSIVLINTNDVNMLIHKSSYWKNHK